MGDQVLSSVDEVSKPPSSVEIVPTVENVVSTVNLGCKIDLKSLVLSVPNAEYCPKRLPGVVVMRIKQQPSTTALIFSSGKMLCTGAKSEHHSKLAALKYCGIIRKIGGFPVKFNDFKIANIVASCQVQFPIRLDLLAPSDYDPEFFPALNHRMLQSPRMVASIFKSGKIVLTGAKMFLKYGEMLRQYALMTTVLYAWVKASTNLPCLGAGKAVVEWTVRVMVVLFLLRRFWLPDSPSSTLLYPKFKSFLRKDILEFLQALLSLSVN